MWWLIRNNYTADANRLIAKHGAGVYNICLNEAWIKAVDGDSSAALHQKRLARRIAELVKNNAPVALTAEQPRSTSALGRGMG